MKSEKLFDSKISIAPGYEKEVAVAVSNLSDLQLWQAFKSGSESAFISIYEKHYAGLVTYGVNFTKDRELIKDCIQDMFLELRETRANLSDTDNIKPYLFKVFRRKISRYLQKRLQLTGLKADYNYHQFEFVISYEQHLINRQIDEEQIRKLNSAIRRLSVKEREAIFHFYFELHSYQEIAEIMGYTQVKTARTLVYRAISSLKDMLEPSSSLSFFFSFL